MTVDLAVLYQQAVKRGDIRPDPAQKKAIATLQPICSALSKPHKTGWFSSKANLIKGAYLYGPVGTGKSFLMDLFFNALTLKEKKRLHFYQFMEMVHQSLKLLEGQKDPLKILAKQFSQQWRVICFDEFFVVNIVDAMLLATLLEAMYAENMVLISTSNVLPDALYPNGLQRDRFLPAIDLIKHYNHIVEVNNGEDYRIGMFDYDRAYVYPEAPENQDILLSRFKHHSQKPVSYQEIITIQDRPVQTLYLGNRVVWFDFEKICGIPRSQRDYLELSEQFDWVYISGIRHILKTENDLICNFIKLIDVLYDAHVKLVLSASVPMESIYTEGREFMAFDRTRSRLIEMQSKTYLALK
jgi:cell division protein ZapE